MRKHLKGFTVGVILTMVLTNFVFANSIKKNIEVLFNEINLQINGQEVMADNILYNGTTYVPLRKAAEMLGKEVLWNEVTKTANIRDRISSNTNTVITPSLSSSDVIESRIDGEFNGWEGETIFKLQNGQIWQQSSFAWKYSYKYSPTVLIYKSGIGYKMKVDGIDGEISVKRLK